MAGNEASAGAAKTLSLAQVSPPRLYFALLHQRFTGTVVLDQPPPNAGRRTIWVDGGMPVFTDWVEPTDVLGQVLLELGYIGQDQLVAALEAMANDGGLLGEVLLSQGSVDPEGLAAGLRKQCFRKLLHTFALREGEAVVTAAQNDLDKLAKINVLELIVIGVGGHFDSDRIVAELGSGLQGPLQATAALARYRSHFRFRPTDEPVLEALLRGTSLSELTSMQGVSVERAVQLIYALWACQMLKVGAAVQATSPSSQPVQPGTPRKLKPVRAKTPVPADVSTNPSSPPRRASTPPPPPKPGSEARPPQQPTQARTAKPASEPSGPPAPPPRGSSSPAPAATTGSSGASQAPGSTTDGDSKGGNVEFIARLETFEQRVKDEVHAFELLGVPLDAGRKEIRRIWADLSKALHPDSLHAKRLGHLRERVSNVFAALSEAHGTLSDKSQREGLRDRIRKGEDTRESASADATAQARAAFESELIAKEGDRFLTANKFDRALLKFEEALKLTPEEPDLRAAAAWCRYNLQERTQQRMVETERVLAAILADAPALARAHFFRGMVQKDLGSIDAALISFQLALEHDRRLIDAERQARALRAQRGHSGGNASDKKKGKGFRGLFGRR